MVILRDINHDQRRKAVNTEGMWSKPRWVRGGRKEKRSERGQEVS